MMRSEWIKKAFVFSVLTSLPWLGVGHEVASARSLGKPTTMIQEPRQTRVKLGFTGGPEVPLCYPASLSASFLPDNQSVTFMVEPMPDGSVRFMHKSDPPELVHVERVMIGVYTTASSWQRAVARFRAAPHSVEMDDYIFETVEPLGKPFKYLAVSSSLPLYFMAYLDSDDGATRKRRELQLSSTARSINAYLNTTECN